MQIPFLKHNTRKKTYNTKFTNRKKKKRVDDVYLFPATVVVSSDDNSEDEAAKRVRVFLRKSSRTTFPCQFR